jgi:hypothetical protein
MPKPEITRAERDPESQLDVLKDIRQESRDFHEAILAELKKITMGLSVLVDHDL